jgi:hypothetical protein
MKWRKSAAAMKTEMAAAAGENSSYRNKAK